MSFFKGRRISFLVLTTLIVLSIAAFIIGRLFSMNSDFYGSPSSILTGVYSIDDGPWIKTDPGKPIRDSFHKIVFKGRLLTNDVYFRELYMSFKNVWVSLKSESGELVYSNTYRIKGSEAWNALVLLDRPEDDAQEYIDYLWKYLPVAMRMPDIPGYEQVSIIPSIDLAGMQNEELILTIENPYPASSAFSDCVSFILSDGNGIYLRTYKEATLAFFLLILVCFFGLFLFPTVSFIFGKVNYRYLTFGFLCFFFGAFMLIRIHSWSLNHLIPDPVLCMMLQRMSVSFFFLSLIVYFRANLNQGISRIVSGFMVLGFFLVTVLTAAGQLAAVWDLNAIAPYTNLLMGVILLIHVFLLAREARTDRNSLRYLLSWIPLALMMFLDITGLILASGSRHFTIYGFSITLAAQLVQLMFDLQRQYKEAIHYQQIQRELYEAKVAVMASQVRPHFMYNALTSIAMMCTIDPPTAQEATITFAKYLRENMDSLRQNKPVPFPQEFEHLKKYLYIEKLRFADKLDIEYEITVTDFVLPLLTVQPLVENAVKHGVGMKKKGGTVKISTRETESAYEIIIADDGVGFDPSAPKTGDGRSHVGMETTRTRLKEMCRGRIEIESKIGEGTAATIILPKEGQIK